MGARKRAAPGTGTPAHVESQLRVIESGSGTGFVELGSGVRLKVTSLGKVFFPAVGTTKGDLMRYYTRVWPVLGPHLKDRALVLKRYPDGLEGPMFFQQNAGAHVPASVRVETIDTQDEGPKARLIGGDLQTLLYTVQMGAIEVHPWLSRMSDVDSADRCLIDLDPGVDVSFAAVVSLARDVLRIATQCALPVAVKTSGSRGIHLVVPLPPRTSYDTSLQLGMLLARAVVAFRPEQATIQRTIKARPAGTIYVDAMQNARGKSMAGPYSVRAKAGATVSAPLRERELTARLRLDAFTTRTMAARVSRLGDLWGDALAAAPTARVVKDAMQALEQVLEGARPNVKPRVAAKRKSAGGDGAGTAGGRRPARRA